MGDQEDLYDNPFFLALQDDFPHLFHHAADKGYTIVVPQSFSIGRDPVTEEMVESHILMPSPTCKAVPVDTFITLNNRGVEMKDQTLRGTTGWASTPATVNLLFEELFYNKYDEQYAVLCVSAPLEGGVKVEAPSLAAVRATTASYNEHFALLSSVDKKGVLSKDIEAICHFHSHMPSVKRGDEGRLLPHIRKMIDTSINRLLMHNPDLASRIACEPKYATQIVSAIESFILGGVYGAIFPHLCDLYQQDDMMLDANIRAYKLAHPPISTLGLPHSFDGINLAQAATSIRELGTKCTPHEKLLCLKAAVSTVFGTVELHFSQNGQGESAPVATDHLLPLLVAVLIEAGIAHVSAHIVHMEVFEIERQAGAAELQFHLATFKAAAQYARTDLTPARTSATNADSEGQRAVRMVSPPGTGRLPE